MTLRSFAKKSLVFAVLLGLVGFAAAKHGNFNEKTVIGNWAGDVHSTCDGYLNPVHQKMMKERKLPLYFTFKKDHTYTSVQIMPNPQTKEQTKIPSNGVWALNGDQLSITATVFNGKKAAGGYEKPRVFTLAKDGKSFMQDQQQHIKDDNGKPAIIHVLHLCKKVK